MQNESGIEITDLTPYFCKNDKVKEARVIYSKDGSRTIEIKFHEETPKMVRMAVITAIGNNLLNECAELSEKEPGEIAQEEIKFLEFMDGAQIREWRNE